MSANTLLRFQEIEKMEDWEAAVAVRNSRETEYQITAEQAKTWAETRPEGIFQQRLLMMDGDRAVGYGVVLEAYWQEADALYNIGAPTLDVDGSTELFGQLFGKMSEIATQQGAKAISSYWRSDEPEVGAWFEANGFHETMTCPGSMVDLDSFDPTAYAETMKRVQESGIELITLNQLRERYPEDWQHRYWRLDADLMHDVPHPEPVKETPFEAFVKQLQDPSLDYDGIWIAMDGDREAGGTQIHPNLVEPSYAATGLTGVRREYRRRGIATALKVNSMARAKARGVKKVTTDNEENNPMYQLNIELGFKHFVDYVLVQKKL